MGILGIGLLLFQVQLGNVSGIVTKPGGTEPLPEATVILSPADTTQTSRIRSAVSQEDGRFTLSEIQPGDYRLQVQSSRYGTAAYGQRKANGPGTILTLAAGQRLVDLKVSMTPTGAIAGRITGSGGEPLANANVQALKYAYLEGKRILAVAQTTTTDDRGEYRLFWLTAGKYVVVAGPRSAPTGTGVAGPIRPGESIRTRILSLRGMTSDALLEGSNHTRRILPDGTIQDESWMPTYYPATTDPAQATAVEVASGATVTGVDIPLGPSPVKKIRGRVTGIPPGNQATVSLSSASQGMIGQILTKSASLTDGSFEIAGVLPGPYVLSAQDRVELASAPMAVLVGDRDVDDVSIALEPTVALSVRLIAEGVSQGPEPFTGLLGILRPDLEILQAGPAASLRSPAIHLGAGSGMTFPSVPPGEFQFDLNQNVIQENIKPLYVKSMRLGREDALGTFRVSANTAVLEVVLTTETGSVEGVAINRTGDPAANVTVVLVPATARKRTTLYKSLVTGSDGKFRFEEIPPGDYKLFAWDDIETGAWENPEFMRPYEPRGREIRVSENGKEAVQLNVIYNP